MTKYIYSTDGFAAFVCKGKAHIIGAVKSGTSYFLAPGCDVVFNATLSGLRSDLTAQNLSILN